MINIFDLNFSSLDLARIACEVKNGFCKGEGQLIVAYSNLIPTTVIAYKKPMNSTEPSIESLRVPLWLKIHGQG